MKFCLTLIVALLIAFVAACSSTDPSANSVSVQNGNSNSTVTLKTGDQVPEPAIGDANVNGGSGDPSYKPSSDALTNKLDKMRKTGVAQKDFGDVESMALKSGQPAPDDSTYASYLTDAGYEVRVFRNHPQLLKVVKKVDGQAETVKIFLRGGKVIDLPGHKFTNLARDSASQLLEKAGIKPLPVVPAAPVGPGRPGKTATN